MTMAIGYLRRALLHQTEIAGVEAHLQQSAVNLGLSLCGAVRHEQAPPGNPLWAAMEVMDQRHGSALITTVTELASRDRVDLRRLLGGPGSYRVLWASVEELQSVGGGHLIVPSMAHLDGMVRSRQELLELISQVYPIVSVLDAGSPGRVAIAAAVDEDLVGEFQVPPRPLAEEIARVNTRSILTEAGLDHLVGPAVQLVHELVSTLTEVDHVAGQGEMLTLRIQHDPDASTLVVTCLDTRGRFAHVAPRIAACADGRITRAPWRGGTSTRCEVPVPTPVTAR